MASVSSSSKGTVGSKNNASVRVEGEQASSVPPPPPSESSSKRREVLIRQPSYCKILNDLKGTEERVAGMKSEPITDEVSTSGGGAGDEESDASPSGAGGGSASSSGVQTISINGQQYQIVSPSVEGLQTITVGNNSSSSSSGSVVQYAPVSQNGQTVFIPGKVGTGSAGASGSDAGGNLVTGEEASRKREIRLLKNREAARECRNKKKEYIKCLENRVAVLENQNKALIEELKSLKELYTGHKS